MTFFYQCLDNKERYVKLTQESFRFRENEVPVCKGNRILNIY